MYSIYIGICLSVVIVLFVLILIKVNNKEKFDPPRSCGLPKYNRAVYGPNSMVAACDVSYPMDGNDSGCCINRDKGLTCQAYQSQDPTKFASICTANVPCMSDDECGAVSKVYNKCAKSGPLKGTCQALDNNGNFMCGDKNAPCTAYDGTTGMCFYGGCQPATIKCTTPDGKNGILHCGVCKPLN